MSEGGLFAVAEQFMFQAGAKIIAYNWNLCTRHAQIKTIFFW